MNIEPEDQPEVKRKILNPPSFVASSGWIFLANWWQIWEGSRELENDHDAPTIQSDAAQN